MIAYIHSPAGAPTIFGLLLASLLFFVWARRRDLRLREQRRRNGTYVPGRPPSQFLAFIVIGVVIAIGETLALIFLEVDVRSILLLLAGIAFVVIGIVGYVRIKKRRSS